MIRSVANGAIDARSAYMRSAVMVSLCMVALRLRLRSALEPSPLHLRLPALPAF